MEGRGGRYDARMFTTLPDDGEIDASTGGDAPDALAAAEAEVREGGDDATAICLRCFAPLDGAPTRCANCGAPASRAATLGPSAGGGVDLGGRNLETLGKTYDGRFSPWSVAIVWGLGMLMLPYLLALSLVADGTARGSRPGLLGGLTERLPFVVICAWTVVCAWFFARARARARAAREATKTF